MNAFQFFDKPETTAQRQYDALREFFYEKKTAKNVAEKYGYTLSAFYSMTRDFHRQLKQSSGKEMFFLKPKVGRSRKFNDNKVDLLIIELRKQYLSVPEIKARLDSQKGCPASESYVQKVIKTNGFARLPRRSKQARDHVTIGNKLLAPESTPLKFSSATFSTQNSAGVLCFLPYIKKFGIDKAIESSLYPETNVINRLSSILSFIALKLCNHRRYSADDNWCMDRGLGLFAGLNVLPKTAWFSSYSSRITPDINYKFLQSLQEIWKKHDLLSDSMNLDFTSIPYWGDDNSHFENNWSGKRNRALPSIQAVLAQDPDSGIIDYGDATIRHKTEPKVILEFLDFYNKNDSHGHSLKYLLFDSKFTPYENLRKIDDEGITFITIRRRGKKIVDALNALPSSKWKNVRVVRANGKGQTLKVYEESIFLKEYGKSLRQIAITGHGKVKPALIITNDETLSQTELIRKYGRRWIVEKGISEQIEFFHLNKVSSSMVIKVDFDLTMSILAYNLYRLMASDMKGHSHQTAMTMHEKFLYNSATIKVEEEQITVNMKKKRNLPLLLETIR